MLITLLDAVLFSSYFLLLFLAIFWLIVLVSPEEKIVKKKLDKKPFFSTIVPAYNEENSIEETLQSLVNLDYPKELKEVIVVNDGSTDKTKEIVENFISQHPLDKIILINQKNGGKAKAMNKGLEIAKGEFFACLDADSFISSNALQEMLPIFNGDKSVAAVSPLMKVKKPENMLQKVQWYEYVINMFYKMLNSKLNCIHVTPGPFSVYRKEVIRNLGGFDEKTITEDLEIAIRLQKHHHRIVQTFDATVETNAPKTWKALFKQRVRWYKGSVDNTLNYRKLMFNKNYGDFGFVRMPTIILSGIIAIILSVTLLQSLVRTAWDYLSYLYYIKFDIFTLIANFHPEINLLDLPFFKLTIALTLILISLFVMVYSYKLVKEKITNHGKTFFSLVTYLSIYGLFITTVWIYIAILFITGKKNSW